MEKDSHRLSPRAGRSCLPSQEGRQERPKIHPLDRYVNEFAGRHNTRPLDTVEQMECIARGLVGKQLRYQDLIV